MKILVWRTCYMLQWKWKSQIERDQNLLTIALHPLLILHNFSSEGQSTDTRYLITNHKIWWLKLERRKWWIMTLSTIMRIATKSCKLRTENAQFVTLSIRGYAHQQRSLVKTRLQEIVPKSLSPFCLFYFPSSLLSVTKKIISVYDFFLVQIVSV